MSRPLSLGFRQAMNAQETGEVPIFLLTVTHPAYAGTLRLSSDPTARVDDVVPSYATVSRGLTFNFVPMAVSWPDELQDGTPQAQLVVSDVNRILIPLLRTVVTPPQAVLELVLASALDSVEAATPQLDIVDAKYDGGSVTFSLTLNSMVTEPYPADSYTPSTCPGLF